RGFIGSAIIKLEYDAGILIKQELESKVVAVVPDDLIDWLGNNIITLKNLKIPINASPKKSEKDKVKNYIDTNLFLLGSSMYNLPSKYYLEDYLPKNADKYCFYEKNDQGIRIIGIRSKSEETIFHGRSQNKEIGFIHRFKDKNTGMMVFLCVGHGSSATCGCVRYLINQWRFLYSKYKLSEFIICMEFVGQEPNADLIVKPNIIWQTPYSQ
ncbi:MAG: hypothetical protein AAFW70_28460, partial [Cyanobacteria bacterium J06635_10]